MADFRSSPPPLLEGHLPSSPPLLTADLPSLPQNRKRALSEYDNLSSDAIFTSDDRSDGIHDVNDCHRPKRMVKGPWWNLNGKKSTGSMAAPKRAGFRAVDSGVWMNSDASDDSYGSGADSNEFLSQIHYKDMPSANVRHLTHNERSANSTIQSCVENGKETVDLASLDLKTLNAVDLSVLQQLLRLPFSANNIHRPDEYDFVPFTPALQLFLMRNQLTALPAQLFNLENITVISLRENELTAIPAAIGKLPRLKELNIASNRIQHLPWELLGLVSRGCRLQARPNPFVEPERLIRYDLPVHPFGVNHPSPEVWRPGDYHFGTKAGGPTSLQGGGAPAVDFPALLQARPEESTPDFLQYLGSGPISWFEPNGLPEQGKGGNTGRLAQASQIEGLTFATSSGASLPVQRILADDRPSITPPATYLSPRVPSLFEIASRRAQYRYVIDPQQWQDADVPPTVRNVMLNAAEGLEWGNPSCSHCGRAFITARAEWVEFWFTCPAAQTFPVLMGEAILPFKRRVCSWGCAVPTGR